jgi:putative transposase
MQGVIELAPALGEAAACRALGIWRGQLRRQRRRHAVAALMGPPAPRKARASPLALSALERAQLLGTLNSERFADSALATVHATLLDEGKYQGGVRTMYHLLADNGAYGERRNQLTHPAYA